MVHNRHFHGAVLLGIREQNTQRANSSNGASVEAERAVLGAEMEAKLEANRAKLEADIAALAAAREAAKQVWLWVRNFAETFTSPSQVPPVL